MIAAVALAAACGGNDSTTGSGSTGGGASDGGFADAGSPVTTGLVAIELSQTDVHIPVGVTTAFAVTGDYSDGMRADVTQAADAASSNTAVATVTKGPGAQIQITAVSAGTATITVTVGQVQKTCAVTVTPRG
ncbi:MAG TPA: Ig-like domain-containing protein [Myxococcales bacterium]